MVKMQYPELFSLRVKGDSMIAPHGTSYPDGCLIFVDSKRRNPANLDRVVVRLVDSNELVFKVFRCEDGKSWLQSLNPTHKPILDKFLVLGTVLGKWEDG